MLSPSLQIQQADPQPLFTIDIALIAAQLQQTLQQSFMDMLTTLQQGHVHTRLDRHPDPRDHALGLSHKEEHDPRSACGQPGWQRSETKEPVDHRGSGLSRMSPPHQGRGRLIASQLSKEKRRMCPSRQGEILGANLKMSGTSSIRNTATRGMIPDNS